MQEKTKKLNLLCNQVGPEPGCISQQFPWKHFIKNPPNSLWYSANKVFILAHTSVGGLKVGGARLGHAGQLCFKLNVQVYLFPLCRCSQFYSYVLILGPRILLALHSSITKDKPDMQAHFKPLLVLYLLTPSWPKQVSRPNSAAAEQDVTSLPCRSGKGENWLSIF